MQINYSLLASTLGLCGSITASSLFFPQVWVSHKTKQTKHLAWPTIIIGLLNGLFWIGYGLLIADPYIYVTNMLIFLGAFLLLMLKRRHG
jgi:uncharacterized protein with PQ loop repeat